LLLDMNNRRKSRIPYKTFFIFYFFIKNYRHGT
jgi:hypothetical protein